MKQVLSFFIFILVVFIFLHEPTHVNAATDCGVVCPGGYSPYILNVSSCSNGQTIQLCNHIDPLGNTISEYCCIVSPPTATPTPIYLCQNIPGASCASSCPAACTNGCLNQGPCGFGNASICWVCAAGPPPTSTPTPTITPSPTPSLTPTPLPVPCYVPTSPQLEGIFSADNNFVINTNGTPPDLSLHIYGSVIYSAKNAGSGTWQNNRTFGINVTPPSDSNTPVVTIQSRPDLWVNLPDLLKVKSFRYQELAP